MIDAESGRPVDFAMVSILQLERSKPTHDSGRFKFDDIPPGRYTLRATRVGYAPVERQLVVPSTEALSVILPLRAEPISSEIVVVARQGGTEFGDLEATRTVEGLDLQLNLDRTVASILEEIPGIAVTSMGPNVLQPVVRGLAGSRLQVLQSGNPTDDASGLGTDHAIAIDPTATREIELLRGAEALLYTGNALAGVVNVIDQNAIANIPDQIHGTGTFVGRTVDLGIQGAVAVNAPLGPLGLQLSAAAERASDLSTPQGTLENTGSTGASGSAALTHLYGSGSLGASVAYLQREYGIPGGFLGGHEDGVSIDLQKLQGEVHGDLYIENFLFEKLELRVAGSDYQHIEYEDEELIGTEYIVQSGSASFLLSQHRMVLDEPANVTLQGSSRITGGLSNYRIFGVRVPETDRREFSAATFQGLSFDAVKIGLAGRFDYAGFDPATTDSNAAGLVRKRSFSGLSWGVDLSVRVLPAFDLVGAAIGTFRAPDVQELFSAGPHLAAYAYEVGNADLPAERGLGFEAGARYLTDRASVRLSLFRNQIDNYTWPEPTGDTNYRLLLPIYQHVEREALFLGAELEAAVRLARRWSVSTSLSAVRASLVDDDAPLPLTPPLSGNLTLRWQPAPFTFSATVSGAAAQERVGTFETSTAGYVTVGAAASYLMATRRTLHTISLVGNNLTNRLYRHHLSRTKEISPEASAGATLVWRVSW